MDTAMENSAEQLLKLDRSRRRFLKGALGTGTLMLLAACAPAAPSPSPAAKQAPPASGDAAKAPPASGGATKAPAPAGAPTQAPAAVAKDAGTPRPGGNLQFLARITPPNLAYYGGGFAMFVLGNPVYDLLLSVDLSDPKIDYRSSEKLLPRLAERWDVQPDGLGYTFHLRRGVKWHDGSPFTAQDVAATFTYIKESPKGSNERGIIASVASFQAADDFTFKVTMSQPDPDFLQNLALITNAVRIHPKHLLEKPEQLEQTMIGTGPFKLESNDLSKATVYVKNPDYWEQGKPYMDRLTIRHRLDRAAEAAAFAARQLDIIYPPDKAVLEVTRASAPGVEFGPVIQDLGPTLIPNQTKPPFNDVRVRRAIHLALDRFAMNQALSLGDGLINPPGVWGNKSGWAIPQEELLKMPGFRQQKEQDLADAQKLLADAGLASGLRTSLIYPQTFSTAPKTAEVAAESLRKIGVTLDLQPQEDAVWLKNQNEGNYDICFVTNFNATPVRQWRNILHSKGALNKAGINDPALDQLIDNQGKEVDVAKRRQMWLDVQKILLEQLYVIPAVEQANYAAWQPWVKDLRYALSANITMPASQNIWLDTEKMPADRR
jgi:peptide/nickel transport system substrate-binding protein